MTHKESRTLLSIENPTLSTAGSALWKRGEKGGNLKVSLCKGRFRGIFDLARYDFDETLAAPARA
jgi:hypothetical protein